ncbi:hypothetical protein RL0247 [Rhizobium johnstonii 3841]|uniref:Uncharacterized protein n=1 Tax=Rhizobium johnstonii (strain DSM 114642 / LMG 32736 / 3841) TaxID=216596 RepID=Q1MMR5_RHIJ3|nr:hypothetical protein RL0247 [Rhizobium johnstonii 3841]
MVAGLKSLDVFSRRQPTKGGEFRDPEAGEFRDSEVGFFLRPTRRAFARRQSAGYLTLFYQDRPRLVGSIAPAWRPLVKLEGRAFGQTGCLERQAVPLLNARPAKRAAVGSHTPASLAQERNRIPGQG